MSQIKKTAIQIAALLFICGSIIWHAVHWHSTGMYLETFKWLQTGKGYITVLYNLGLMLALGITLGLLMEKIMDIIDHKRNAKNKKLLH